MKRGASGLCGVLAIDKPQGVTSHDVVNVVRRLTGEKRVGHAGTLDPMATGLMLVCVGAATRLSTYLTGHDKSYTARIVFGAATDTDDADGRIIRALSASDLGEALSKLEQLEPQEVLNGILGTSLQLPPAFSAIKKNGVTAYKAAREGKEIELEPREVTIDRAALAGTGMQQVKLSDGEGGFFEAALPYWDVNLAVSKGTYIRSIARDLGQKLGCGAHLGALRRASVADCSIEEAHTLEELAQLAAGGKELPWADPVRLLGFASVHELSAEEAKDVSCGRQLVASASEGFVSCVYDGKLAAIYKACGNTMKPDTVIPGGVVGVRADGSHSARLISWDLCAPASFELGKRVMLMGVFDGLHKGHKTLFAAAREDAQRRGLPITLVTFDKDPDELFGREPASFKLMSNAARLDALCKSDDVAADEVVAIVTDKANLGLTAEEFLERLAAQIDVASIHVGSDFRFGKKAAGTVADIEAWCERIGAECCPQVLYESAGEVVTATRIRGLLAAGDADAASKLGSRYVIRGKVVHGRGEGADMGFATANVEPESDIMLPRDGVYGGYALVGDTCYAAAVNMGVAASFENATSPIEAHLLGYKGDLYGKTIEIKLVHWLRPQIKFDNLEDLIATVTDNINWVRENLVPKARAMRKDW